MMLIKCVSESLYLNIEYRLFSSHGTSFFLVKNVKERYEIGIWYEHIL